LLTGCTLPGNLAGLEFGPPSPTAPGPGDQILIEIPLQGAAALPTTEISGLAWYGDDLILLPQFPRRMAAGDGAFLRLSREEITDFLDGVSAAPLQPRLLPIETPNLGGAIPGFDGFESILFVGDRVYVTVEAHLGGGRMMGWIMAGEVVNGGEGLRFDPAGAVSIQPQANLRNMSDEAILAIPDEVDGFHLLTFYEANGRLVNPRPVAHRFTPDLIPLPAVPLASLEFRLTDVGEVDEEGRFWAINYFFTGEMALLFPREQGGGQAGPTEPVEQLVELRYTPEGIRRTETPPIRFTLRPDGRARNWEGLVTLEGRGFLVATDRHPQTILAFVPR
jgi:hypothetical protein